MTYRKKLIEVALPLDEINAASAREKSIRHGHPSTLHLWWARRPLAACRAVLFASLVDDPSNDLPEDEAMVERERLFEIIRDLVKWENSSDENVLGRARKEILRSYARPRRSVLCAAQSPSSEHPLGQQGHGLADGRHVRQGPQRGERTGIQVPVVRCLSSHGRLAHKGLCGSEQARLGLRLVGARRKGA